MDDDAAKREEDRLMRSMGKTKKTSTPVKRATPVSVSTVGTTATPVKQSKPPVKQSVQSSTTGDAISELDALLDNMSTNEKQVSQPKQEQSQNTAKNDSQNLSSSGAKQKWQDMQKEQEKKKQEEEKKKQEYLKRQADEIAKRKSIPPPSTSTSSSNLTATQSTTPAPAPVSSAPKPTTTVTTTVTQTSEPVRVTQTTTTTVTQPSSAPKPVVVTRQPSATFSEKYKKQAAQLQSLLDNFGRRTASNVDFAGISDDISTLAKQYIKFATASESEFEADSFVQIVEKIVSASEDVCYSIGADYNRNDLANQLKSNVSTFLQSTVAILTDYNSNSRQKSLTDLSLVIKDLQECFNASATRCDKCGQIIESNYVKVGDKSYHSECFVCHKCRKPLSGYFEAEGNFYCEEDYKQYTIETNQAVICKVCGQVIEGQYLKVDDNPYHPDCFRCSQCGGEITGKFFEKKGAPVCENCIKKEIDTE